MSKKENDDSNKIVSKNVIKSPKKNNSTLHPSKLSNLRIIQKHLVYVIGLSSTLANKDLLGKYEYFGQYGTILKIVVNKTKAYNPSGPNGPSYSAYISYSKEQEASVAILAIDNIEVEKHILRASYGTTKYCTFFLKNLDCPNKDCLYLHYMAEESDIVNRDDMNSQTNIFYEQQLLAMSIADIFHSDVKKKLKNINNKKKCILPTTDTIYTKDIVLEQSNGGEKSYGANYNYNYYGYDEYEDYDSYDNYNDYGDYNEGYGSRYNNKGTYLHREKSESFTSNTSKGMKDDFTINNKFISKSKSPITMKKKNFAQSINKGKKIEFEEVSNKSDSKTVKENTTGSSLPSVSLPVIKKLYTKREESRFPFVKNKINTQNNLSVINITTDSTSNSNKSIDNTTQQSTEGIQKFSSLPGHNIEINNKISNSNLDSETLVPDYVSDVICKKISRHTFFKKFEKYFENENTDYLFFQKHLKSDDSWSKFIISNSNLKENK